MRIYKQKDISGLKIGSLTNIKSTNIKNIHGRYLHEWKCDCGNIVIKTVDDAKNLSQNSCGHNCKLHFNPVGQTFGRLLVLKEANTRDSKGSRCFNCLCFCGNKLIVNASNLQHNHSRSCGCLAVDINKNRLGSKHHNYIHGRSNDNRLDRSKLNHRDWVRKIKRRDNYTCQKCQFISLDKKGLAAHHINCYSDFPKEQLDLNNGITLCQKCHSEFHKKYGWKTTRKDFEDFIK